MFRISIPAEREEAEGQGDHLNRTVKLEYFVVFESLSSFILETTGMSMQKKNSPLDFNPLLIFTKVYFKINIYNLFKFEGFVIL